MWVKNHEILGPASLGNDYYRLEAVRVGILGDSFFLVDTKIGSMVWRSENLLNLLSYYTVKTLGLL